MPLLAAFAARLAVALIHAYVVPLPGGTADAVTFEQLAWEWAQNGVPGALEHFNGPTSDFYAVQLAVLYALTGRSALMGQALSVLAAMGAVLFTYLLTRLLWSEHAAKKATWVVALFPLVILYSVFTMRESFIHLTIVSGLYCAARWSIGRRARYIVSAFAMFGIGLFYHTGMVLAIVGLSMAVVSHYLSKMPSQALRGRVSAGLILMAFPMIIAAVAFAVSGVRLQKIGSVATFTDATRLVAVAQSRATDGAAYPEWVLPSGAADLIWNVPARVIYFLFSPFPWDIGRLAHVQGLLDGLLYMGVIVLVWRRRQAIRENSGARMLLWILVPLVVGFAMGSANFGNAMRHRAKLLPALVVLAAPLLPRLVVIRSQSQTAASPTAGA